MEGTYIKYKLYLLVFKEMFDGNLASSGKKTSPADNTSFCIRSQKIVYNLQKHSSMVGKVPLEWRYKGDQEGICPPSVTLCHPFGEKMKPW